MRFRLGIFCIMACAAGGRSDAISVYHIGNSLTWDSQPIAINSLATDKGYSHEYGYHIRCNSSLGQIVSDPTGTCVDPTESGTYGPALANTTLDAVTLQPYGAAGATLGSEADSALSLIAQARANPDNSDTRFFIYAPWGLRSQVFSFWTNDVVDDDDTPMASGLEHSQLVYNRVKVGTDADVQIIPVGQVMYEVATAIENGELPGYTSSDDLFRDHIHASYSLGRYIASATTFATLYEDDLTGISSASLGPSTSALVNAIILDVLDFSMAIPGDYDGDGNVTLLDYNEWSSNYGDFVFFGRNADGNLNGVIDAGDYTVWRDAFAVSSSATIPEPSALLLLASGLLASNALRHRRN